MMSVTFDGPTTKEVAEQARHFADTVLGPPIQDVAATGGPLQRATSAPQLTSSPSGYQPQGVGLPRSDFSPVDDGSEWDEGPLRAWISRLVPDGRKVVGLLAISLVIDPRAEAKNLGWGGTQWAGVWTGPRRQAKLVKDLHGLQSWPYGHSYDEPRRLWMHPDIAKRVKEILNL